MMLILFLGRQNAVHGYAFCSWATIEMQNNFFIDLLMPYLEQEAQLSPRDRAMRRQSKYCQLPSNSAETTCTTSPEQIEVMNLEG